MLLIEFAVVLAIIAVKLGLIFNNNYFYHYHGNNNYNIINQGFQTFSIEILSPVQSLLLVVGVIGTGVALSLRDKDKNKACPPTGELK